jgi:hypothetical protein
MRVFVDGQLHVEDVTNRRTKTVTKEISLEAGRVCDIRFNTPKLTTRTRPQDWFGSHPGDKMLRDDALSKAKRADAVIVVRNFATG